MLEVMSEEVIAAQVAGEYAKTVNERAPFAKLDLIGSGVRMFADSFGTHYSFPVNVNTEDSTRVGDIIVIVDFNQVVGCFLR